jgi:thiopeptide-type bacteriocin biosynthesis protein
MKEADQTGPGEDEEAGARNERLEASLREDESVAVSRKKVLLRLLALAECRRLGISLTAEQANAAVAKFRRRFGLGEEQELEGWLASTGTARTDFERLVTGMALVDALEAQLAGEIDRELPLQRAARSVYSWKGETWIQFNVELRRDAEGGAVANAVLIFNALWPLVDPGTRPADVRRFFAMRKPPGLRLRFAGPRAAPILHLVGDVLDILEREGPVVRWSTVPYEPERARFGGASGMDLAHRWFEADSLGWFCFEALAFRKENGIGRDVLSRGVLYDLFLTVLRDVAEVWDVWFRLAVKHDVSPDAAADGATDIPVFTIEALKERARPAEFAILSWYESANLDLAGGLGLAAQEGRMGIGRRELLATIALFHWNRYGLAPETRRAIFGPMLRALDPRKIPGERVQASAGPSTS